ncbi:MAG: hypothetical protein KDA62_17695, partial [Planctomycetales bacterium]|nr:hypothetical protein [Planctomycetales bacterium]
KPAEEKPAEEKPAEEKPAEETSTEEPSSEPAASDQSNRALDVTKFVALLDEESDSSEENAPATEPKTESDPKATEPPASETGDKPAEDKPAEDKPAEDKPAEETAVEEKPMADEKPTAEKPAAAETPAEETPAEETAGDAEPAETTPASDSPAEVASEPRIQPLSEVRDEIAEALATPLAREKRDEALQAAENELATYYGKLAKWEALKDTEKAPKKPEPINAEALAKKHNLTAGSVPLSDPLEVDQYELGQTRTFSFANQQFQQFSFAELTYGPNVALFEPQRIRGNVDEDYLYWATEQVEEHVPDFKEAREQVERAWKLEKARELAQEKARELAQKAEKANQPLAEVFPDKAEQILSPEAFSWITSGSVPMMGGMPHLSSVEGVEYPSSEFMGDVFKLDPGQVGVAANQPKTTWYVVRLVEESPAIDQLRNGFMEANYADTGRDPSLFIAFQEKNQLFGGWYENLEEQMDVNWARPGRSLMGGG